MIHPICTVCPLNNLLRFLRNLHHLNLYRSVNPKLPITAFESVRWDLFQCIGIDSLRCYGCFSDVLEERRGEYSGVVSIFFYVLL
jgi:hypothetical protein